MPAKEVELLVVDDEPLLRLTLSLVLTDGGYRVRCAEDGFDALREMRREAPDILLSDLNMPGMSGFELLSVVRRRFPATRTIATSGAYAGDDIPDGVLADAFYPKGTGMGRLLQIVQAMSRTRPQSLVRPANAPARVWLFGAEDGQSGNSTVPVTCPDCLRTFPQPFDASVPVVLQVACIYCSTPIPYAVVRQRDAALSNQAMIGAQLELSSPPVEDPQACNQNDPQWQRMT